MILRQGPTLLFYRGLGPVMVAHGQSYPYYIALEVPRASLMHSTSGPKGTSPKSTPIGELLSVLEVEMKCLNSLVQFEKFS